MLFHVFEWKALCCPKDMSALDDLVHDFVYCLQVSLVLKALRLFPRLLRFPRRENRHGYWTLLCLQRAREAKRSWAERQGAITQAFALSGCVITALAFWEREEERDRGCAWFPTQVAKAALCYSCLAILPVSSVRFGSNSRLSIVPHSCHPTAK